MDIIEPAGLLSRLPSWDNLNKRQGSYFWAGSFNLLQGSLSQDTNIPKSRGNTSSWKLKQVKSGTRETQGGAGESQAEFSANFTKSDEMLTACPQGELLLRDRMLLYFQKNTKIEIIINDRENTTDPDTLETLTKVC